MYDGNVEEEKVWNRRNIWAEWADSLKITKCIKLWTIGIQRFSSMINIKKSHLGTLILKLPGWGGVRGDVVPSTLRLFLWPLCWMMTYRQAHGWWPVPGSRVLDFDPRASSLAFIPHPQTSERGAPFYSLIAPKSLMHHSGH